MRQFSQDQSHGSKVSGESSPFVNALLIGIISWFFCALLIRDSVLGALISFPILFVSYLVLKSRQINHIVRNLDLRYKVIEKELYHAIDQLSRAKEHDEVEAQPKSLSSEEPTLDSRELTPRPPKEAPIPPVFVTQGEGPATLGLPTRLETAPGLHTPAAFGVSKTEPVTHPVSKPLPADVTSVETSKTELHSQRLLSTRINDWLGFGAILFAGIAVILIGGSIVLSSGITVQPTLLLWQFQDVLVISVPLAYAIVFLTFLTPPSKLYHYLKPRLFLGIRFLSIFSLAVLRLSPEASE